jgi:hypothetical protein
MSAYNWIEIEGRCPSCGKDTEIKCQTHFCSDYDGDNTSRFHDRTYKLGHMMAWWPSTFPRYSEWIQSNSNNKDRYLARSECCYSECLNCGAELFVVIRFNDCSPVEVLSLGLEVNWPEGYFK